MLMAKVSLKKQFFILNPKRIIQTFFYRSPGKICFSENCYLICLKSLLSCNFTKKVLHV